jgi:hypothetical protein
MRRSLMAAAVSAALCLVMAAPAGAQPSGVEFQVAETPAVPEPGVLSAVAAIRPSDAWAVGDAGGQAMAEHWNGTQWTVVPTFAPGDSSTLLGIDALASDDVWAVGAAERSGRTSGLIEHWDGTSWTRVPIIIAPELNDIDFSSATDGWAVGMGPYLAHWDGSVWAPTPAPPIEGGEAHQVVAFAPNDVWAVGAREVEGGIEHDETMLLHWDGSVWTLQDNPATTFAQEVWAVDAISPSDIWAVGEQETGTGQRVLTLHYDGSAWSVVPARNPGTAGQELVGVVAIATDDVWAVGTYDDGIAEHPMAQHWNGTRWRLAPVQDAFGSPAVDSLLAVDASSRGDVWAVGLAGASDAELQPLVERAVRT